MFPVFFPICALWDGWIVTAPYGIVLCALGRSVCK